MCGCKTSTVTALPDGATGYTVSCDGTAHSWADCYNRSAAICTGKYNVISQYNSVSDGKPLRTLIIKCE